MVLLGVNVDSAGQTRARPLTGSASEQVLSTMGMQPLVLRPGEYTALPA